MIKPGQVGDSDDFIFALTAGEALTANDACYVKAADGKVYKCDADDTSTLDFVGFAQEGAVANASVILRHQGQMDGFSSLTIGAKYYISGTAGLITSTIPSNARFVGIAVTATTIRIRGSLIPVAANGIVSLGDLSSGYGTTTIAHGLGVKPISVRLLGLVLSTFNGVSTSDGHYDASGQNCLVTTTKDNNVADLVASQSGEAIRYDPAGAGSDYIKGVVSVDQTNITITWTKVGSPSGGVRLMWSAQGWNGI